MARGKNPFRQSDVVRAIKSARDAGIEPAVVEVVLPDGTIIRVKGPQAAGANGKNEWDEDNAEGSAQVCES
jgi:hypothetical protein